MRQPRTRRLRTHTHPARTSGCVACGEAVIVPWRLLSHVHGGDCRVCPDTLAPGRR